MNSLNFISPRDLEKNNVLIHNVNTNYDAVVGLGVGYQNVTTIGTVPINNFYDYLSDSDYYTMDGCPIVVLTYDDNWINLSRWNKNTLTNFIQNGSPVIVYYIMANVDVNHNFDISSSLIQAEIVNSIEIQNNCLYLITVSEEQIYIDTSGQISVISPEPEPIN